jgi:hypothetical protein
LLSVKTGQLWAESTIMSYSKHWPTAQNFEELSALLN